MLKISRRDLIRIIAENLESEESFDDSALDQVVQPIGSIRTAKSKFKKAFLEANPLFKGMSPGNQPGEKEVRLGHSDSTAELREEDVLQMIRDLGYGVEQEVMPGAPGSMSSKYKTYRVSTPSGHIISVVFGSGNKGEKFEAALRNDLVAGAGDLGDPFLDALGMQRSDVVSVDEPLPARKRPLTDTIQDIGKEVSDITIRTSRPIPQAGGTSTLYISLKDPQGKTLSNSGYAGGFEMVNDTLTPASHSLDQFVTALGIDKEKIAVGVMDYISQNMSDPEQCEIDMNPNFDAETIGKFLASGLGYGYVYARLGKDGSYHVEYLNTPEDSAALVGTPIKVAISYARHCGDKKSQRSKGTRAAIICDNGAKYSVAIRNKNAKAKPDQIMISILKYPSE